MKGLGAQIFLPLPPQEYFQGHFPPKANEEGLLEGNL